MGTMESKHTGTKVNDSDTLPNGLQKCIWSEPSLIDILLVLLSQFI